MKYKIGILCLLFCVTTAVKAQVTIGMEYTNERAALLDLKSQKASSDNTTTTVGGLLLPRVNLVDLHTLEPFINTNDAQWTDAGKKSELMQEHIGLEVYNLSSTTAFQPGAYVWNGTQWEKVMKELIIREPNRIVFPLPAFNLPLIDPYNASTRRLSVDLYQVYVKNMHANYFITTIPNKGAFLSSNTYLRNELDYVVTHYDPNIITIHGISDEGVMEYTVHNINPDSSSFLNIYLVVHKGKEKQ